MVKPLSQTPGFTSISPSVIEQVPTDPVQTKSIPPSETGGTPLESQEGGNQSPVTLTVGPSSSETEVSHQEVTQPVKSVDTSPQIEGPTQVQPDSSASESLFSQLGSVLSGLLDLMGEPDVVEVPDFEPMQASDLVPDLPEMQGYTSVLEDLVSPQVRPTPKESPSQKTVAQAKTLPEIDVQKTPAYSQGEIIDTSATVGKNWNFGKLKANSLVIHHTAGRGTVEGVISTFKKRGYPAHFIIDRDGKTHQVLGIDQRGRHTKNSKINDVTNANSWGVEIIAKDDDDVTPAQVQAAVRLAKTLNEQYGMPMDRIFGHGEINPHKQKTEGSTVVSVLRNQSRDKVVASIAW